MVALVAIIAVLWIIALTLWVLDSGSNTHLAVNIALADESPVITREELRRVA